MIKGAYRRSRRTIRVVDADTPPDPDVRRLSPVLVPVPAHVHVHVPDPGTPAGESPADRAATIPRVVYRGKAIRAERARCAWQWRLQGHAPADIVRMLADQGLGSWSIATIEKDIARIADARTVHVRAQGERLRTMELARLDTLLAAWHGPATQGDVYAAPVYLRIVEMRAKLLGLDQVPAADPIADRPLEHVPDDELLARIERARVMLGTNTTDPQT